jgi:peptidyl-prolyl cis-trans isomerase D
MAISWMQRHKKWLIVTIWISTIAFVGAGFVGWGSYNYGKSDGTVAVVGDKEVPLADLQQEYSALYSQYQNMFGGKFTQEMAKQLGLEKAALQRIVNKYLLLNYADELNLMTTDEEIAKELVKIQAFFKDGKFDKNTYLSVLKQNRKNAADFEAQLKQDLLVTKVQKIFNLKLEKNEIANIGTLIFLEDKVSVKLIDGKSILVTPTLDDLKKYYEKHKENYKSPKGYAISYTPVANIEGNDKKAMKKVALKKYLDLKKDKIQFEKKVTLYDNTDFVSKEDLKKIISSKDNEILKPIYKDNQYFVIKKEKNIMPQILEYKAVGSQINRDYIAAKKAELLDEKAKNMAKDFTGGIDLGYINRNSKLDLKGLEKNQIVTLKQHIFSSTKPVNYINLGDNTVAVYKITDSKFIPYDTKNDKLVISTINSYKSDAVSNALLEKLHTKYDVKTYMTE